MGSIGFVVDCADSAELLESVQEAYREVAESSLWSAGGDAYEGSISDDRFSLRVEGTGTQRAADIDRPLRRLVREVASQGVVERGTRCPLGGQGAWEESAGQGPQACPRG